MSENALAFRKYTLKCLGTKERHVYNLTVWILTHTPCRVSQLGHRGHFGPDHSVLGWEMGEGVSGSPKMLSSNPGLYLLGPSITHPPTQE